MSHRVTINEAVKLSGRSRRSLYRDMGSGRLAYHVGYDDRRLVDVSELIRAYGALPGMAEEAAPDVATAGSGDLSARLLAELVEVNRRQADQLERMAERIDALEAALLRLPAPSPATATPPPPSRAAEGDARGAADPEPSPGGQRQPPRSLDDVLARFEARTKH